MKIAFLGSRGIPNDYGGFEQFTQYMAVMLAKRGHEVTVYSPSYHPYREAWYKGVRLIHVYSPEPLIGSAPGAIVYDYLCLKHALRQEYDVIYETGYTSLALSYMTLGVKRSKAVIVTNMDGMEFERAKYKWGAQKFLELSERIVVKRSHKLIADNMGIQDYYGRKYGIETKYLAYGAECPQSFDKDRLADVGVEAGRYCLIIARLEPENNIDAIVRGYLAAGKGDIPLIIVGNTNTSHASALMKNYDREPRVRFIGGLYDINLLNSLRHYCWLYFHGHSVGGTNPSLLEAMACGAHIVAHDNVYNRSVLGGNALYFRNSNDVRIYVDSIQNANEWCVRIENNIKTIKERYSWTLLTDEYEAFFKKIIKRDE